MDRGINMMINKDIVALNTNHLKKYSFALLLISFGFLLTSCANTGRYNTQKGALGGAGVGAIAGQLIGRNTQSTLIGAGAGALLGAVVGNTMDQRDQETRDNQKEYQTTQAVPVVYDSEAPPGRWVTVSGRWEGNRWIPAHRQWIPVNPE
jgi:outer membrane lipoprotein SlyB